MRLGLLPIIAVLIVGCSTVEQKNRPTVTTKNQPTLVVNGQQYVQVRKGQVGSNGISDMPLYQKIGDTNRWYTPALTGTYMIPIAR